MNRKLHTILIILVLLMAASLRMAGLFRGLPQGIIYHLDSPKQIHALDNYLHAKYVWYIGSLFSDGYPYGLNHADEWIVRPIVALTRGVRNLTEPGWDEQELVVGSDKEGVEYLVRDPFPDSMALYYWVRSLRVVYSLLALMCAYWIARRIKMGQWASLLVALLVAIAPLSITVAHFGTGDVGVDLMTALVLLLTAFFASRDRGAWSLLLAGAAVGLGFAVKFQGLLVGYVLFVFLVLRDLWARRHPRVFFKHSLSVLLGVVAGCAVAMPELFIDWTRSIRFKIANFKFIAEYAVSEELLNKPFLERTIYSFKTNFLGLASAFGSVVFIVALVGLFFAVRRVWRQRSDRSRISSTDIYRLAAFSFPVAAIIVSLSGKPFIQAYHFSYLQIPLCLAAVFALVELWNSETKGKQGLVCLLAIAMLLELGVLSKHDYFFWSRADNSLAAVNLSKGLTRVDGECPGNQEFLKSVKVEGENMAAYRNRVRDIVAPRAGFWRAVDVAPVPRVPFSGDSDYIFANGPVLPRDDRMFLVRGNDSERRSIVFPEEPASLAIGLRTATRPAQAMVRVGDKTERVILRPNSQVVLDVPSDALNASWVSRFYPDDPFSVPLRVDAEVGEVWVTVLDKPAAREFYELFGGTASAVPQLYEGVGADDWAQQVACAYYIDGDNLCGQILRERGFDYIFRYAPLPAGFYILTLQVFPLVDGTELQLSQANAFSQLSPDGSATTYHKLQGLEPTTITQRFSKAFAPYQFQMGIQCVKGGCMLGEWRLVPDTEAILERVTAGNIQDFTRAASGVAQTTEGAFAGVRFGRGSQLVDAKVPAQIQPASDVDVRIAMDLTEYPFKDYEDYYVFLHLLDSEGEQIGATEFPLSWAVCSADASYPIACRELSHLPPGEYSVWMGVYNRRTQLRLPLHLPFGSDLEENRSRVQIGRTTIAPSP